MREFIQVMDLASGIHYDVLELKRFLRSPLMSLDELLVFLGSHSASSIHSLATLSSMIWIIQWTLRIKLLFSFFDSGCDSRPPEIALWNLKQYPLDFHFVLMDHPLVFHRLLFYML